MTGQELKQAREQAQRTQVKAARELGVSQTYLSMIENNKREAPDDLSRKAARLFHVRPENVPLREDFWNKRPSGNARLAAELSALNYPYLSYHQPRKVENPVEVLLGALKAADLERRLVEGLPWILCRFSDLDWKALFMGVKVNDAQNRLGFLLNVAWRVAEREKNKPVSVRLRTKEGELKASRLSREDTLCQNSMTQAERNWLTVNRPKEAAKWGLLTDLSPDFLNYYDL